MDVAKGLAHWVLKMTIVCWGAEAGTRVSTDHQIAGVRNVSIRLTARGWQVTKWPGTSQEGLQAKQFHVHMWESLVQSVEAFRAKTEVSQRISNCASRLSRRKPAWAPSLPTCPVRCGLASLTIMCANSLQGFSLYIPLVLSHGDCTAAPPLGARLCDRQKEGLVLWLQWLHSGSHRHGDVGPRFC